MLPWFGDGDKVGVILKLEAVEELEPLDPAASVLILGPTCRALFKGIFTSREQSHESITDGIDGNYRVITVISWG